MLKVNKLRRKESEEKSAAALIKLPPANSVGTWEGLMPERWSCGAASSRSGTGPAHLSLKDKPDPVLPQSLPKQLAQWQ